jgi:hypothetical protein
MCRSWVTVQTTCITATPEEEVRSGETFLLCLPEKLANAIVNEDYVVYVTGAKIADAMAFSTSVNQLVQVDRSQ